MLDWPCSDNERIPRTNIIAGVVLIKESRAQHEMDWMMRWLTFLTCNIHMSLNHIHIGHTHRRNITKNATAITGGLAYTPTSVRAIILENTQADPTATPTIILEDEGADSQQAEAQPTTLLQTKMTMGDMLRAMVHQ